ncbi:hypothetical protein BTN49_3318 [Candidatus Enterovibrio escicola]|uniref:Uncharacterized protein n=1 Tax=Candidatus Enterovibrio escicola TaxID=1927127 RepID=A0A2A5SZ51_9GAMM|nr:hypothetical protein BTN49_3318 [Candidatus Enterovibrio escacola]
MASLSNDVSVSSAEGFANLDMPLFLLDVLLLSVIRMSRVCHLV